MNDVIAQLAAVRAGQRDMAGSFMKVHSHEAYFNKQTIFMQVRYHHEMALACWLPEGGG